MGCPLRQTQTPGTTRLRQLPRTLALILLLAIGFKASAHLQPPALSPVSPTARPAPSQTLSATVQSLKDSQRRQLAFLTGVLVLQGFIILALALGMRFWRKLQEEKGQLAHTLGNVLDAASEFAIIATDPEGRITIFNRGAEKMLGYQAKDMLGQSPMQLHLACEIAERAKTLTQELGRPVSGFEVFVAGARQKGSESQQWTYIHKDGHRFTITLVVTIQRDHKGQVTGFLGMARDITREQEAEQALTLSKQRYRSLFSAMSEGVVMQDKNGQILAANKAAQAILGLDEETLQGRLSGDFQTVDSNGNPLPGHRHPAMQTLATGAACHNQVMGLTQPGGAIRWLSVNSEPVLGDGSKEPQAVVATFVDITERKAAEDKLRLSASVFANSYEGIMVTDAANRIVEVNPAFTRITGYSAEEVIGRSPSLLASGRQDQAFYQSLWDSLNQQDAWRGEIWNRRKSGEVYAEILAISAVRDQRGQVLNYIGVFSDISQIKAHEKELDLIAHYDPLTGLPNRRLLGDLLGRQLAYCKRRQQSFAVAFIDLDGFKPVNDTYGHQAGDELLVEIAKRLKMALRDSDIVARLGGDEFVVLLNDVASPQEMVQSLRRVLAVINEPADIEGNLVQVSASIGVTSYPEDGSDAEILLRHADQAMYKAKQAGKNRYHLFDLERDKEVTGYQSWLNQLQDALNGDQLQLYYQPKVDLASGEVAGCEALLRWQHPTEGLKVPGDFLPQLLSSDLDLRLGQWVLEKALCQLEHWQQQGLALSLSVNISASHLLQQDFAEQLATLLAKHPNVSPRHLELEIVETSALTELDQAALNLAHCKKLGVRTALDDFGTGYASLTYLRRLPLDCLKIDQGFVSQMLDDPNDLCIVENVITMARALNRNVVAEGVESQQQAQALLQLGCSQVQGYGLARPMPASSLDLWLASWQRKPRWRAQTLPPYHPQLPLVAAAASHRLWVERSLEALTQASGGKLALSCQHCSFGQWFFSAGMARYGHLESFLALEALHEQSHSALQRLVEQQQQHPDTKVNPQGLFDARDRLLQQIGRITEQLAKTQQVS